MKTIFKTILYLILFQFALVSCNKKDNPKTSSGYMDSSEFKPTVDKNGEYSTIDGSANQVQYQGSKQQSDDLKAIDDYAKDHPDF